MHLNVFDFVPTRHGLLVALTVSVLLHGALLRLSFLRPDQPSLSAPIILVTRLLPPSPAVNEPVRVQHSAASSRAKTTPPQGPLRTAPEGLQAGTSPADAGKSPPDRVDIPQTEAMGVEPALDLSPQTISRAVRQNTPKSPSQRAHEQLGHVTPTPSKVLASAIAGAAIPDCLRNAQDGEGGATKPPMGGLLALPYLAYSAMAGKCK